MVPAVCGNELDAMFPLICIPMRESRTSSISDQSTVSNASPMRVDQVQ